MRKDIDYIQTSELLITQTIGKISKAISEINSGESIQDIFSELNRELSLAKFVFIEIKHKISSATDTFASIITTGVSDTLLIKYIKQTEVNELDLQMSEVIAKSSIPLPYQYLPELLRNLLMDFELSESMYYPLFHNNKLLGILLISKEYLSDSPKGVHLVFELFANTISNHLASKYQKIEFDKLKKHYNHFVMNSNDGLLITENYEYVQSNPKFDEIYNIKDKEYFSGRLSDWGVIDLLDVENFVKFHKKTDNKLYEMENWVTINNKDKKCLRKKFYDYRSTEESLNYLIVNDITELKQQELRLRESQERFRLITELTTDCSYSFAVDADSNLYYEWSTASHRELFGEFSSTKKYRSMWDNNICPEFKSLLEMRISNLLMGRKDVSEYKVMDKKGKSRWIRDYAIPVFDNYENRVIRIIGAASDITEAKAAEEELLQKTEQLKYLNVTKDKFFSIISHDMKNPIYGFKNLTELLEDDYANMTTEEIKEIISAMRQSAGSLHSLFDDLVQWSKAQMGGIDYRPAEYNLFDISTEVIKSLQTELSSKDITVVNSIGINCLATFDREMIKLVLRNLLTNAIKFSYPNSAIQLNCRFDAFNSGNNAVEIEVKDFGIGINQANIQKLFRIDQKISSLGTANEKGSGLGLLLCKEFINMHKGAIWAECDKISGTSFKFTIPN